MTSYYFDASIWLDIFEEREESYLNKYKSIRKLLKHIISYGETIFYSGVVFNELIRLGYTKYELYQLFKPYRPYLIYVWYTNHHYGRARDLALKRNLPLSDALHAFLARDSKCILVSRDKHFQQLRDIIVTKSPEALF